MTLDAVVKSASGVGREKRLRGGAGRGFHRCGDNRRRMVLSDRAGDPAVPALSRTALCLLFCVPLRPAHGICPREGRTTLPHHTASRRSRAGRARQRRARRLHAGVEWGFWLGPTECSGTVLDLGKGSLLEKVDRVKVVRCDQVQWRFLGLSLAGYNALISLLMAAISGWGFFAAKRSQIVDP